MRIVFFNFFFHLFLRSKRNLIHFEGLFDTFFCTGNKPEEGKEENTDKIERVTPPVVMTNNHNTIDHVDPVAFSDDESDIIRPIKIEEEDDDVPLGKLINQMKNPEIVLMELIFLCLFPAKVKIKEKPTEEVFAGTLKSLKKEIRDLVTQLNKEKNNNRR